MSSNTEIPLDLGGSGGVKEADDQHRMEEDGFVKRKRLLRMVCDAINVQVLLIKLVYSMLSRE